MSYWRTCQLWRQILQDSRRACFEGGHVLEEATLIACLFSICCRSKQWSFLVSKYSLYFSLVDMSCKCDWCSSSVSFWCHSVCWIEICCTCEWYSSTISFYCLSVCLVDISVFSWISLLILLEAQMYVLVAFHLTSLCFSCLALDFFCLEFCFSFSWHLWLVEVNLWILYDSF